MSQAELPQMPPRPEPPPAISEKDLQTGVISTAHILGYRVAHFRSVPVKRGPRVVWETPVQADGKGFPDLFIVGNGRRLWRELKVGRNTLSSEQAAWLEWLRETGEDAGVWTDADWFAGLIEADLRRGTRHEREVDAA